MKGLEVGFNSAFAVDRDLAAKVFLGMYPPATIEAATLAEIAIIEDAVQVRCLTAEIAVKVDMRS